MKPVNFPPWLPEYADDCCVFLGTLNCNDLYYCDQRGMPTVIARSRWGQDGDYESGMCFSYGQSFNLTQARLRAEYRGLC